jgi:uncharacterized membrane protein
VNGSRWELRVWWGALAFTIAYGLLDWWRWASYHAGGDFGMIVQAAVDGFPRFYTAAEGASHFVRHFSPVFALFTPPVRITHSVVPLFFIQAAAGALVAPPLYLLAAKRMAPPLAAGVAAIALLYPPLAGLIFGEPYETVFAPAATVWLLYAIDAGKLWLAAAAALFALSIKEDQALFLAAAGAALALWYRRREPRVAAFCGALALVSIATFVLYFAVVRSWAGATTPWPYAFFFAWGAPNKYGATPLLSFGRFGYLLEIFVPLLFVPFRSIALWLAVPPLLEVLGSHESVTFMMGQHYAGVWIGFVLVAYALGLAAIAHRSPRLARGLAIASLALCVLDLAFASPTHWRTHLSLPTPHDARLGRMLAALPPRIDVGTYDEAYSHLGFDPNATVGVHHDPRFILLDTTEPGSYEVPVLTRAVAANHDFRLLRSDDGIEIYQRVRL